jgi:uncharacterized protein YdiU (UPF0061 family)
MNKQLYEFWGNYLITLARGHQQFENFSALLNKGPVDMKALFSFMRRVYGLEEAGGARSGESALSNWNKSLAECQRSLNQFAASWGWVPQAEHQRVLRDCQALQKQVDDQKILIDQLRDLLTEEGHGHTMLVDHLQRSFEEQNRQFQSLMKSIGGSLGEER